MKEIRRFDPLEFGPIWVVKKVMKKEGLGTYYPDFMGTESEMRKIRIHCRTYMRNNKIKMKAKIAVEDGLMKDDWQEIVDFFID